MRLHNFFEAPMKPGDVVKLDKSYSYDEDDTLGSILSLLKARYSNQPSNKIVAKDIKKIERLIKKYSSTDTLMLAIEKEKRQKLLQTISRRCSNIVELYKKTRKDSSGTEGLLYRGVQKTRAPILFGKPHTQRRPVDSDQSAHDLVNQVLTKNGFDARRDNSIFATAEYSLAKSFGYTHDHRLNTYVIFPVNGFSYTWSPVGRDLVFSERELSNAIKQEKQQPLIDLLTNDDHLSSINNQLLYDITLNRKIIPLSEYNKTLIDRAISQELIPPEYAKYMDIDQLITDQDVMDYYQFKNTDLEEAIKSGKEVYINGEYYAVNVNLIEEINGLIQS